MAAVLFIATCISVFLAGLFPGGGLLGALGKIEELGAEGVPLARFLPQMLRDGLTFFAGVMSILVAHEMGHYLQARRYRVPATVPYFIPFPLAPWGTMGAVIIQGAGVADRKSLFDIAISGPLAGLVFAIPITVVGVMQSRLIAFTPQGTLFGDPLLVKWLAAWIHGPVAPGAELELNALLFAGWVGIFITALNLMPIGQLDGGHVLYTLIGRKAHRVALALVAGAICYMILSGDISYMVMLLLLVVFGPRHPPTANDNVALGPVRLVLGWLTLSFVIIGFTPTPFPMPSQRAREETEPRPVRVYEARERLQKPTAISSAHAVSEHKQQSGTGPCDPVPFRQTSKASKTLASS